MKAPASAYATKDDNFVKSLIRQGGTVFRTYVARFLKGTAAEGGYDNNSSANMRGRIKSLFHLDELFDYREKQTDGSMKSIGFIGAVIEGGDNAKFHNLDTRDSKARMRVGTNDYIMLGDAGLNTRARAGAPTVRYAFANYYRLDVPVIAPFYEGCSVRLVLSSSSSGSPAQDSMTSTLRQRESRTIIFRYLGGMSKWDNKGTVYLVADVTTSEGTMRTTTAVQMLAPLNYAVFAPVESVTDVPSRNDEGLVTLLIDTDLEDYIYDVISDKSEGSTAENLTTSAYPDEVAKLGDGSLGSQADETLIQSYYNLIKNGTGSVPTVPGGSMWVNVNGRHIGTDIVHYGIVVNSGRVQQIFRARTPVTTDTRPELILRITIEEIGNNQYTVLLELMTSVRPDSKVTVRISRLTASLTQGGNSLGNASFRTGNPTTGPVFAGTELSMLPSGLTNTEIVYLTTDQKSFWVNAAATCDSNDYRFVNNGGNSTSGPAVVEPGE